VASACAERTEAEPAEAGSGWSQLPASPIPADRLSSFAFWAGDRLVWAGGLDVEGYTDESSSVSATPTGDTYTYLPGAGEWAREEPLGIPGFDGAVEATGAWTGDQWLGQVAACEAGSAEDFAAYVDRCRSSRWVVSWRPGEGWTVLGQVPADAAYIEASEGRPQVSSDLLALGVLNDQVVFSSTSGSSLLGPDGRWTYTPWPDFGFASSVGPGATCLDADRVLVAVSDDPQGDGGGPVFETNYLIEVDPSNGAATVLWKGPDQGYRPGAAIACTSAGALYQPDTGPINALVDGTLRPLPQLDLPETDGLVLPVRLSNGLTTVDAGVLGIASGPTRDSWYLDASKQTLIPFPGTLDFEQQISTGDQVFARLNSLYESDAAGQWFLLDPGDDPDAGLPDAVFPLPLDLPMHAR
jgi:hypothetical protein